MRSPPCVTASLPPPPSRTHWNAKQMVARAPSAPRCARSARLARCRCAAMACGGAAADRSPLRWPKRAPTSWKPGRRRRARRSPTPRCWVVDRGRLRWCRRRSIDVPGSRLDATGRLAGRPDAVVRRSAVAACAAGRTAGGRAARPRSPDRQRVGRVVRGARRGHAGPGNARRAACWTPGHRRTRGRWPCAPRGPPPPPTRSRKR